MFDYWYGNHKNNDVLCIRYDQIYNNISTISNYLNLNFKLPPFRKRESDWTKRYRKDDLYKIYGDFNKKIQKNESKLFKCI
jgi:hypothetical protein